MPLKSTVLALTAILLGIHADGRYGASPLGPQGRKTKLQQVWLEQLVDLASQKPILMLLEDAHWIDPTSLEQFDLVVDRIQRMPVLLVVTYRPEFQQPWGGHAHVTALPLERFGPRQSATLIERVTGGKTLPAPLLPATLQPVGAPPLLVPLRRGDAGRALSSRRSAGSTSRA